MSKSELHIPLLLRVGADYMRLKHKCYLIIEATVGIIMVVGRLARVHLAQFLFRPEVGAACTRTATGCAVLEAFQL